MRDQHDKAETRSNLVRWAIEHSERLQLDLRVLYFRNDCLELVLGLLPRDLVKCEPYRLLLDYVLGNSDAEHAIAEELRFALCELQKQQLQRMGLA